MKLPDSVAAAKAQAKRKSRDDSTVEEGPSTKKINTGPKNPAEVMGAEMDGPKKRTARPKKPVASKKAETGAKKRKKRVVSTALVADEDMADDEPSDEIAGLTMADKGKKKADGVPAEETAGSTTADKGKKKADEGTMLELKVDGVQLLGLPGEKAKTCERCHSTGQQCIRTGTLACQYCRKMKSRCSLTERKSQKTKGVPRIKPKKHVSMQPTDPGPSHSETNPIPAAMPDATTATDAPTEQPKAQRVKAPARQRISVTPAHPDEPRGKMVNLSAGQIPKRGSPILAMSLEDITPIPPLPPAAGPDDPLGDTEQVQAEGPTEDACSCKGSVTSLQILVEEHRQLREDYRVLKEASRVQEDSINRLQDEVMAIKAGLETQRQLLLPRPSLGPSLPRMTGTPAPSIGELAISDLLRSSRLRSDSPRLPSFTSTPIKTETNS
jgi:hypothetical protein